MPGLLRKKKENHLKKKESVTSSYKSKAFLVDFQEGKCKVVIFPNVIYEMQDIFSFHSSNVLSLHQKPLTMPAQYSSSGVFWTTKKTYNWH